MAMTKCKECKKDVSTKADVCPHCGVKKPGTKASEVVGGLAILVLIGFGFSMCSEDQASAPAPSTTQQSPSAPKKTPEQVAQEDAACRQSLECWGNKHSTAVGFYCDDSVERLAKYSFEWTDGMLDTKFSHFRWLDKNNGLLTYIGDKIKLQNGFGAWQNYVYECDVDPVNRVVLDVRAEPGMI